MMKNERVRKLASLRKSSWKLQVGQKEPRPLELSFLWLAEDRKAVRVGPDLTTLIVGGQVERQKDGSWVTVQNEMAFDYLKESGRRGMRICPAVTQMLKNSKFDGAVSGTPGTPPTNWNQIFTAPGSYVINGQTLTMSATAGRAVFFQDFSALANTLYYLQLSLVVTACSSALDEIAVVSGLPTGATLSRFVDGASALGSVVLTPGVHLLEFVISIGATAGTPRVRFGVGCLSTGSAIVEFEKPMLSTVKTAPYIATGPNETITQPSAAATTGGNGASIAMDQRILEAFRGKQDGVERVNLGQAPVIDNAGMGSVGAYNQATKTISNSVIGTNNAYPRFDFEMGAKVVGERYLCRVEFSDAARVAGVRLATSGTTQELTKSGNVFSGEIVADNTSSKFDLRCDGTALFSTSILSATVQKLTPAVCTVMAESYMGVGSGDLAVATTNHSLLTCTMAEAGVFYFRGEGPRIVSSYDGQSAAFKYSSWSANEIHRRYVQTNATGTKYRVGYQRYTAAMIEVTNGIAWSHASADEGSVFDQSFNPLQWLRFGLTLTVPIWVTRVAIANEPLSDEEITLVMEGAYD